MRDGLCGVRDAVSGMRCGLCGVRDALCGMRDALCDMREWPLWHASGLATVLARHATALVRNCARLCACEA
eukprot:1335970-Pleurochrysis_carterae.AAC.1